MSFIFMDESGDLGFDFSKPGATSNFLITFLFAKKKRPIEKCVRKTHAGLRKRFRKVGVLHAYHEEPTTRKRLLSCLAEKDCKIMTIRESLINSDFPATQGSVAIFDNCKVLKM